MTVYPARCRRWVRLCWSGCRSPAMRRSSTPAAVRAASPRQLIERVPRGRIIGVDVSESMVAAARERLGPAADIRRMDLLELEIQEPIDAIFSTATFHWVADHDALFRQLHTVLMVDSGMGAKRVFPNRSAGDWWPSVEERATSPRCGPAPPWCMERDPYAEHFRDIPTPVELREPNRHRSATASGRVRHRRMLAAARAHRA